MIVDKRVVILGTRCRILYYYFEPDIRCDLCITAYDGSFHINLALFNNDVFLVSYRKRTSMTVTKPFVTVRAAKLEVLRILTNFNEC